MSAPRVDWRDLPPVPEEERPEPPSAMSQTLLGYADRCMRAAMLHLKHRGGAGSARMFGGGAFHEFAATAIETMVREGEVSIPPDVAKAHFEAVMAAHPEWMIPSDEEDDLRMMVWHFAQHVSIDPRQVVAVEKMVELDLEGWVIRGRIDLAERPTPTSFRVRDWKTGFDVPSPDDFRKGFQIPFYSVLSALGQPIVGEGRDGRREAFPMAGAATQFEMVQEYPRIVVADGGRLASREHTVDRPWVLDHVAYIARLVKRVEHALETGRWPAVPGSHCARCPAKTECPLPAALRNYHGGDPETLAAKWWAADQERTLAGEALKAIARESGPIPLGTDYELGFTKKESTDWKAAARGGEPRTKVSTAFGKSKRKAPE